MSEIAISCWDVGLAQLGTARKTEAFGPWNTDGLIIVPDALTLDQSRYVHDLLVSDFPIIIN